MCIAQHARLDRVRTSASTDDAVCLQVYAGVFVRSISCGMSRLRQAVSRYYSRFDLLLLKAACHERTAAVCKNTVLPNMAHHGRVCASGTPCKLLQHVGIKCRSWQRGPSEG